MSFARILEVLARHQVEFVVVGGVAAVLHGAPVTTFDLDALVRVEQRNADRLMAALGELEATVRGHTPALRPTRQDVLAGGHLLLMTRAGPLDILGFIGGGSRYEDLEESITHASIGGCDVPILALDELIRQKKALGRDKDLPALRLLEDVARRRVPGKT